MRDSEKLKKVTESAGYLFIRPGYAETKMKNIAEQAHLSVGTLYNLFESKEALLDFVFFYNLDPEIIYKDFHLPIKKMKEKELISRFSESYQIITDDFEHKFIVRHKTEHTFKELLNDLFNLMESYGQYFLIIEKNPRLNEQLLRLHTNYRKTLFENVHQFLIKSIGSGTIRPLSYPSYDARLIIDTLMWWCAHKRYDSFEIETNYSSQITRKVAITALLNAYQKT